jgi:hypothetical protein
MYDEYARKSGSSQHEIHQDVVVGGSPIPNVGSIGTSTPELVTDGPRRSRVVSTAMKQSMWEAEHLNT